jgi:hypothetical protein
MGTFIEKLQEQQNSYCDIISFSHFLILTWSGLIFHLCNLLGMLITMLL